MGTYLPLPDVTPLRGGPVVNWGVLAPGEIADAFATTLHRNTEQRITAVASRSAERAAAFAARHGILRAYGDYASLVADPAIDIVYIAAPNPQHLPLALLAIGAGKAVLVEKPLAMSFEDGMRIAEAARTAGVFAGEAMWTRYLPQSSVLRQVIDQGMLGDIRLATADVGWAARPDPESRFMKPELGGGTVLDAGVYGFWFAQFAIGRPVALHAAGTLSATGVEDQAVTVLTGVDGRFASVTATMAGTNTGLASVVGTAGAARFLDPFVFPARFSVRVGGDDHEWHDDSGLRLRDGLAWQAAAVARDIAEGRQDSSTHPMGDALDVLRTLDGVRAQIFARPDPTAATLG